MRLVFLLQDAQRLKRMKVFMQVLDQPDAFETGGLYFPMAVSNLCKSYLSLQY